MSNASTGSRACEFCYARKVKCIMTDSKVCRACKENRIECRQRETRRQGRPRGHSKHTFRATPSGSVSDMSSAGRSPPCAVRADSAISIPEEDLNVSAMAPLQQQDPFAFFDFSADLTNFSNAWDQSVYPSPPMSTSEQVPQQMYSPTSQMTMGLGQADLFLADMADMVDNEAARVGSNLFNGYLEMDGMLKRILSGGHVLSMPDFGDQGAVIQQLSQVVAAATEGAKTGLGPVDRSVMRLAILAVRKACELADYGLGAVMSVHGRRKSSVYQSPHESPVHSRRGSSTPSSAEQISAMIRVDHQLAMLKAAIGSYASRDRSLSSTEKAAVNQCQNLLLPIHVRIKRAMDAMVPEWGS